MLETCPEVTQEYCNKAPVNMIQKYQKCLRLRCKSYTSYINKEKNGGEMASKLEGGSSYPKEIHENQIRAISCNWHVSAEVPGMVTQ